MKYCRSDGVLNICCQRDTQIRNMSRSDDILYIDDDTEQHSSALGSIPKWYESVMTGKMPCMQGVKMLPGSLERINTHPVTYL